MEDDDEEDPLDAFMDTLEKTAPSAPGLGRISKYDEEDAREDPLESFAKDRAKKTALTFKQGETLEELDYDSDDLPVARKRMIEPLAALDHKAIAYEPFVRNFYRESQSTAKMTDEEVSAARKALKISVQGHGAPRLVTTFSGFTFPENLNKTISDQGFERPTPIQMQTVPAGMSGRDLLGIAATGSGKTLSFVWPMLLHVCGQKVLGSGEPGPIGIIVAPTRELANQIYEEARKYARSFERLHSSGRMERAIRVAPLLGGLGRGDTRVMLKSHSHEIVVATPGRLIDMIKAKLISTFRTTMLVLDEADKMFDMGFEPQIKSIVGQLRPDRQTLLFSATFKPNVESLARDILRDPIRITVGTIGAANQDVTQVVEVCADEEAKWHWLSLRLDDFVLDGAVLVFAGSKQSVEDLTRRIKEHFANNPSISAAALHGDKSSDERRDIMQDFKLEKFKVLVATDLAARGLDVKAIKTVVNFQPAKDIDSHTHRIGRTGRAGDKHGIAYTLLMPNESHFAGLLVKNLESARQDVPPELLALAHRQNYKGGYKQGGRHQKEDFGGHSRHPREQGSFSGNGRADFYSQRRSSPPRLHSASYHPSNDRYERNMSYSAQNNAGETRHSAQGAHFASAATNTTTVRSDCVPPKNASLPSSDAYDPFGSI